MKQLDMSKKKLKDTTLLFQETDKKNFDLSMNSCCVLMLPLIFLTVVKVTLLLCL